MRVGLVVPCYIDVSYPEAGIALWNYWKSWASKSSISLIRPVTDSIVKIVVEKD